MVHGTTREDRTDLLDSGPEPGPRQAWRRLLVVGAAALALGGLVGARLAGGQPAERADERPTGRGVGAAAAGAGEAASVTDVLHGRFVLPDPDGGFRVVLLQRGRVVRIDPGEVTVRSADGVERVFTITETTTVTGAHGRKSFARGDEVSVTAERRNQRLEATHVTDLTSDPAPR